MSTVNRTSPVFIRVFESIETVVYGRHHFYGDVFRMCFYLSELLRKLVSNSINSPERDRRHRPVNPASQGRRNYRGSEWTPSHNTRRTLLQLHFASTTLTKQPRLTDDVPHIPVGRGDAGADKGSSCLAPLCGWWQRLADGAMHCRPRPPRT
jgi:hypothetical protein